MTNAERKALHDFVMAVNNCFADPGVGGDKSRLRRQELYDASRALNALLLDEPSLAPKRTVTIEISEEDAREWMKSWGGAGHALSQRLADACCKAMARRR